MSKSNVNPVFKSLDERGEGAVTRTAIMERLAKSGIALSDARLSRFRKKLEAHRSDKFGPGAFEKLLRNNGSLFERVVKSTLIVPDFYSFRTEIKSIYESVIGLRDGKVADYIPQLARISEDKFAVAICTIDGQRFEIGDVDDWFTLQSSCKPVLYSAALEEHGENKVHGHVGREPSGLSFNELTLNKRGLPHNPMINAGAIMSSSLMRRDLPMADRLDILSDVFAAAMGDRPPRFNNAVFHSEKETADRNFALAHHMRERGAFPDDTDIRSTLDYYFSACSLEVTASSMSMMGATFANGGVCPTTGERVFAEETVKNTLSMMYSCGMYDYSGEFAFSVGIPAKSSVSGVVFAVVPNLLGISVWSPRLDECGNSVRGVEFLKRLVDRFCFHNYDSLVDSKKLDPRRIAHETESNVIYQAIHAASVGDIDELKRLVAHGHDLDIADYDGRTPLHLAAAEGQQEAIEYLLAQGVSKDPRDRWGNTPFEEEKAA
jgi:glutaminase